MVGGDGALFGGTGGGFFDGKEGGGIVGEAHGADDGATAAEAEYINIVYGIGQLVELFPVVMFEKVAGIGFGGRSKSHAVAAAVDVVVDGLLETPGVATPNEENLVVVGKGGDVAGAGDKDVGEPGGFVVEEEAREGGVVDFDVVDARQLEIVGLVELDG